MRAISLKAPRAWLVVEGFCPMINWNEATSFRGRIWVHAGKEMTDEEYDACVNFARRIDQGINIPSRDWLKFGGLIGQVEIVDCVDYSKNRWFTGPYALALRNPYPLPFKPCRGQLGLFEPEIGV